VKCCTVMLLVGYRHIGLRSEFNQPQGVATLFVHIQVKDYIIDAFAGNCRLFLSFLMMRVIMQCCDSVSWVHLSCPWRPLPDHQLSQLQHGNSCVCESCDRCRCVEGTMTENSE